MLPIQHIQETCLYVRDLDRTQAFYHGVLGLPIIGRVAGRHVFFRAGNSVLLCFRPETTARADWAPHYGSGQLHLAFQVPAEQYDTVKAQVQALGITIEHEQPWGDRYRSFYFRDPDGHCLEIVPAGMWGE